MSHRDQSDSYYRFDGIQIEARKVEPGMALNTHQDVFWEVIGVRESDRHPGYIMIELVHDRRYTYAADELVTVIP